MGTDDTSTATVLKVRANSDPTRLASALSHAIYDGKEVSLRAIGAGAVNQSCKGVAIARSYVASRGMTLTMVPGFTSVKMDDGDVTAMLFRVIVS